MSSTKCKSETPWALEVELRSGRALYLAASEVLLTKEGAVITTDQDDTINVEKENIRKLLIMSSNG